MSENYEHIFEQIAPTAAPYVIYFQESHVKNGLVIELNDEDRGRPEKSEKLIIKNERIRATSNLSRLFTRAVEKVKEKLQEKLAEECDEPEMRLWLARNRDVDYLDNSDVPLNLRKMYQAHLNPSTPRRPVVRTTASPSAKEGAVPVKTSKGVPVKEQKRVPHCPVHRDEPMLMDVEAGKWRCSIGSCRLVAKPKEETTPVGKLVMGKGQLDLRVVYPDDGSEPSIVLIADNNVALDVTSLVDRENFLKYNDYKTAAARAKAAGASVTDTPNRGSVVLKFPKPARVFGCEHS